MLDEKMDPLPGVRGAYGYLDAHPLARQRLGSTPDYLRDRLGGILRLVPGDGHQPGAAEGRAA